MKIWKKITEEQYIQLLSIGVDCWGIYQGDSKPSNWEMQWKAKEELEYHLSYVQGKDLSVPVDYVTCVEVDDNDSTVSCTLSENQST